MSDTQSGFRAISRSAIEKVDLKETDMPFATEMLIQFAKKGFKIVEVPSTYKIRRYGKPKLQPFKAGTQIIATILKGLKQ